MITRAAAAFVFAIGIPIFMAPAKAGLYGQMPAPRTEIVYFGSSAWLGVGLADLTSQRVQQLHLSSEDGAEVKDVLKDGPAAKAGIEAGDVIVRYHGSAVTSVTQLRRLLRETPAGRTVTIGVIRTGRPLNFRVKLASNSSGFSAGPVTAPRLKLDGLNALLQSQQMYSTALQNLPDAALPANEAMFDFNPGAATLGISVEDIPRQLATYFGVNADSAVLVRAVTAGSIAEEAGFKAGDVVLRVASSSIATVQDFRAALSRHRSEKTMVRVRRSGRELDLSIPALAPRTPEAEGAAIAPEALINARSLDWQSLEHSLSAAHQAMSDARLDRLQQALSARSAESRNLAGMLQNARRAAAAAEKAHREQLLMRQNMLKQSRQPRSRPEIFD
jgi:serine protease Do